MIRRILIVFAALCACSLAGGFLNSGTTSYDQDNLSEGFAYQVSAGGTWDGATVTVSVFNHTLGDYVDVTTLNSTAQTKRIRATGQKLRASISGGSGNESIAFEALRIPIDNEQLTPVVTADEISDSTAAGRALITAADAPAQRTALKIAAETNPPTNGEAAGITITGELVDDGGKSIRFPKLYEASSTYWTWDGKAATAGAYEALAYYDGTRWGLELRISGVESGRWQANAGSEASPALATGWAPVSPATGTPVLTAVAAVEKTPWRDRYIDLAGNTWIPQGTSPNHTWVKAAVGADQFFHNFGFDASGKEYADGATMQRGKPWLLTTSGSAPKVDTAGRLGEAVPGSATVSTWYGGTELDENVFNFGAEAEWVTTNGANPETLANYQLMTILIMPDATFSLDKLIHIVIRNYRVDIDFSTKGGVSSFRSITLSSQYSRNIPSDKKILVSGRIQGANLELSINGNRFSVNDPRVAQLNGKGIRWEQIGNENIRVRYHRLWANSPSVESFPGIGTQPRAINLDQLAAGYLRQPLGIPLGGEASGTFGFPIASRAGILVDAVASNGTTGQSLWSYSSKGMPYVGSQWRIKAFGRFAANGNNKLVKVVVYQGELSTGTITQNGGTFEIDMIIFRATATNYKAVGSIRLSSGVVYTGTVTGGNWPVATPISIPITVDSAAASDVILDAAFVDYSP